MITLLSNQVPTPTNYRGFLRLKDAENPLWSNAPTARSFKQGETFVTSSKLNRNATQLDLTARYGGGGYAIAHGLTLKKSNTTSITIEPGHAIIDGIVEVDEPIEYKIPKANVTIYLWILRTGRLWSNIKRIEPPDEPACYIGTVFQDQNKISLIDTSGVMYLRGGQLWRETAENGSPNQKPSINIAFFHKTKGGIFIWDGKDYSKLTGESGMEWIKISKSYQDFSSAKMTEEFKLYPLKKGNAIHALRIENNQVFSGNNITEYNLTLKTPGAKNDLLKPINLAKPAGELGIQSPQEQFVHQDGHLIGTIKCKQALDKVTFGNLDIWLLLSALPI